MAGDERRFDLPGVEDLTKDQEKVLAFPREGLHLVVGGPGTGKTVVCLLRARRHSQHDEDYQFLVWNHLLHRASRAVFSGQLQASTWNRWFGKLFWERCRKRVPKLEPPDGTTWKPVDWRGVREEIRTIGPRENGALRHPLLVIDEGQDMPSGFYESLLEFGYGNLFVAADQNQQIKEDEHSSRDELENLLGVGAVELRYNFRNSYPIARLAREFYTGDPASPPPELPPNDATTIYVPRLYYVEEAVLPRIARSVLRHWDQDPRRLIGVIAPNNLVRDRYLSAVKAGAEGIGLDNGVPRIETFHGGHHAEVRFDRGGILVINAAACKGLEFDTVVLADIDEHRVDPADQDRAKKLFYVMVSRARKNVVMFMRRDANRELEEILPKDQGILRREDLTGGEHNGRSRS